MPRSDFVRSRWAANAVVDEAKAAGCWSGRDGQRRRGCGGLRSDQVIAWHAASKVEGSVAQAPRLWRM